MDDLKTLQPTIFPVVPRLLNRMFDRVSSKEQQGGDRALDRESETLVRIGPARYLLYTWSRRSVVYPSVKPECVYITEPLVKIRRENT